MNEKINKKVLDALTASGSVCGAKFVIPLVIPEGMESGDGRKFKKGAIELRELPLPLLWQIKTGTGHDGSVVVGRIDHMEQTEEGIGNAYGVFDTGVYGREAERLVREGFLKGVSADMDRFEATEEASDDDMEASEKNKKIKKDKIIIDKARVMAVTIVPKPAFQECKILLAEDGEDTTTEEPVINDGIYFEDADPTETAALIACGLIASSIPMTPPAQWFANPELKEPTPLTVSDDGRVFGHIAAWHVDHIGMAFGTRPPRSRSNYGYFHTGVCRTEEGNDVPVGQLTLAGGHADIQASAADAVKHYDDTASAFADVHAGEDAYGIWVAGALRPGTTPEQIRQARASAPSGDWRPIRGSLELVAVCQVNVPGFPIARARVASGQVMALVAAGASTLARLKHDPMTELASRVNKLEEKEREALIATAEDVRARFNAIKPEKTVTEENVVLADGIYHEVEPQLVHTLEQLLADVIAMSFIAQGYHWNVKGADFKEYHAFFGSIYEDVYGSVDALAENILKLGYDAPFTLASLADMSPLGTHTVDVNSCAAMAYDLFCINDYLVSQLKSAFMVADANNEQGIADFIAGRIDEHQRWSWQLRSSSVPAEVGELEDEMGESDEPYTMVFSAFEKLGVLEAALTASADDRQSRVESFASITEFAKFTEKEREELAKKGEALEDGSYPIRNVSDLKNAIRAYGRAPLKGRMDVRKHIIKRAIALGARDLIPEQWANPKNSPSHYSVEDMRSRIADFSAQLDTAVEGPKQEDLRSRIADFASRMDTPKKELSGELAEFSAPLDDVEAETELEKLQEKLDKTTNPADIKKIKAEVQKIETETAPQKYEDGRTKFIPGKTQPRDAQGKFRTVLARLKYDLGTSGNQRALEKVKEAENLDSVGDYAGAVKASSDLIEIVDRLDAGALNAKSIDNVRASTAELGKVIANLPLPFENQNEKIRYSDMPAALKELTESLIKRVEDKIGKEDADKATEALRAFKSGNDYYSQGEISSQLNRMLRLLT